jgi:hypothetical protein
MTWTQALALQLCQQLETVAHRYGAHVALTGGCLYKDGERKDCDILIYRVRQVDHIDLAGLFQAWADFGVHVYIGGRWVYKAKFWHREIDFFVPEEEKVGSRPEVPDFVDEEQRARY